MDISDLVTQADYSPVLRRFIDRGCDVGIRDRALFQDVIEGELTWSTEGSGLLDQRGLDMWKGRSASALYIPISERMVVWAS